MGFSTVRLSQCLSCQGRRLVERGLPGWQLLYYYSVMRKPTHTVLLQVLALDVILANGTRKIFTNETDPFLMKVSRGLEEKHCWCCVE